MSEGAVHLASFLGALADAATPGTPPSYLTQVAQMAQPLQTAQANLTQQQAQQDQLQNQQTQSALQALTNAKQNNPNAGPAQLYGQIASATPAGLTDYIGAMAKNPLAMSAINWQAGQQPSTQTSTNSAQKPAADPYALVPQSPDDKRNYEFLNTQVPPQYRALVRQISNGDESVGNADSLRSNGLLALAAQFDPSLSKTNFADRLATAKDFSTAGKSGQFITSANNATGHLAKLAVTAIDLHNGQSPDWNHIENWASQHRGQDPTTNYNSVADTVAPEVAKAAAGGGDTSDADRSEQRKDLGNVDGSPEQIIGAITNKVDLIQSKAKNVADQYQNNMGRPKEVITSQNAQTLQDLKVLHGAVKAGTPLNDPKIAPVVSRLRSAAGMQDSLDNKSTITQPSSTAPNSALLAKLAARAKSTK